MPTHKILAIYMDTNKTNMNPRMYSEHFNFQLLFCQQATIDIKYLKHASCPSSIFVGSLSLFFILLAISVQHLVRDILWCHKHMQHPFNKLFCINIDYFVFI